VSVFDAPRDRPLLAPLFAALAAEVEQLDVQQFLADPSRRARIYADLWRTLRPDILVVDSGSGWEAGDHAAMIDLLQRVRAVVPEPTLLGVTIGGPASPRAQTAAPPPTLAAGVQAALAAARVAAQAGAGVIFVREDEPEPPEGYERATAPLWASLKFFRAAAVLLTPAPWHIKGPLPCSPVVAEGPHGLAVAPGAAPPPRDGRCVLLTHTGDLAGHVPVRDLQSAVEQLRSG
jgi:hypothetical protein